MRNFVLHIYHAGKEGKAFEAGFRGEEILQVVLPCHLGREGFRGRI
jgi:hypothetical protein